MEKAVTPETLRDKAIGICLRELSASCTPEASAWLGVTIDAVGQVVVTRHADDRYSGVADTWVVQGIVAGGVPNDEMMLVRHAARLARGWQRRAATGGTLPLWSYSVHRLVAGILTQHGLPIGLLEAASRDEHRSVMTFLSTEKGVTMSDVREQGGRIDVASITPKNDAFTMSGRGRPFITIPNVEMPYTIVQSLIGKRLSDVVKDPCIERAGPIRINGAELLDGANPTLLLILADTQIAISRPPKGIDRSWLRMPFHPWAKDLP